MIYVTIDGDDIGQKISFCYLNNDEKLLKKINDTVQYKVSLVADFFRGKGFKILFCAADGVAALSETSDLSDKYIYDNVMSLGAPELTFSVGIGTNLRESYIALLSAKSSGKAKICNFRDVEKHV